MEWKAKPTRQAKRLRRNLTNVERALWRRLRDRGIGAKFRRQHPIGRYVVDFVCIEAGLVVEIDGGQHAEQRDRDALRTRYVEAEGYRVIRFWNNDVTENIDGVLSTIASALAKPSPQPSPASGRGSPGKTSN
ncbi:MAG: endonuclease domain-containing protein [Alphaproteobacteria bacterium]|nr:endonuclease domain-containing protein [Alphaproteobacteria bacterium]